MASLSSLYRLLRKYRELLYETQQMVDILIYAIDDLEPAVTKIGDCYLIDDMSADLKQIDGCRKKIESNKKFLNDVAIPEIKRKIRQIQKQIEALEADE